VMGKGERESVLPLGGMLLPDVHRSIHGARVANAREIALFTSEKTGGRLGYEGMATMIERKLRKGRSSGKRGAHVLRHIFANNFLGNHGRLEALRKILRHIDIRTTRMSMHLSDADGMKEHAEASPLDHISNS